MGNESFPIHAPFIIGQSWGMIPWAIHAPFSFPIHWEFCSLPIHGESPWPIQGPVYCHGPFIGLGACAVEESLKATLQLLSMITEYQRLNVSEQKGRLAHSAQ